MGANEGLRKNSEERGPRIEAALMAVFPNPDSYASFVSEDRGDPAPFVRLAREHDLISKSGDEKALKVFIRQHARAPRECTPPAGMSLSALLEDREKIRLSVRGLTGWINRLVAEFGLQAMMPSGKVSNAMFSRLARGPANTPSKRNALRLLSFWFGYKRPELGKAMNYETLRRLCGIDQAAAVREGGRIGFLLHSRGHVIEEKTVKWLKDEVRSCVRDLGLRRVARMRAYHTTSFYLDLPVENDSGSGPASSKALSRRVRDALAIAHQMAVRWSLAAVSSQRRIMTIGIAAGEFDMLDEYLQAILNAKITGDPVIRMTESARQCVLMNDIRAVFCRKPITTRLITGELANVRWVTELWNTMHWDFVPEVADDDFLKPDPKSEEALRLLLWAPEHVQETKLTATRSSALQSFLRSPSDLLLGLEIAKTLYFRQQILEAVEIVKILLSADPTNVTARTFDITLHRNLAVNEGHPYSVSKMHFDHAERQAQIIEEEGMARHEDFYCEYGYTKVAHAIRILRLLRSPDAGGLAEETRSVSKDTVYAILKEAEDWFRKGSVVSPTGTRSRYEIMRTRSLLEMLRGNERAFTDSKESILDSINVCRQRANELYLAIGFLRRDFDAKARAEFLRSRLEKGTSEFYDSILLKPRQPNIKYAFGVLLWDFSPISTVVAAKNSILLLHGAIELAREVGRAKLQCGFRYNVSW